MTHSKKCMRTILIHGTRTIPSLWTSLIIYSNHPSPLIINSNATTDSRRSTHEKQNSAWRIQHHQQDSRCNQNMHHPRYICEDVDFNVDFNEHYTAKFFRWNHNLRPRWMYALQTNVCQLFGYSWLMAWVPQQNHCGWLSGIIPPEGFEKGFNEKLAHWKIKIKIIASSEVFEGFDSGCMHGHT